MNDLATVFSLSIVVSYTDGDMLKPDTRENN